MSRSTAFMVSGVLRVGVGRRSYHVTTARAGGAAGAGPDRGVATDEQAARRVAAALAAAV